MVSVHLRLNTGYHSWWILFAISWSLANSYVFGYSVNLEFKNVAVNVRTLHIIGGVQRKIGECFSRFTFYKALYYCWKRFTFSSSPLPLSHTFFLSLKLSHAIYLVSNSLAAVMFMVPAGRNENSLSQLGVIYRHLECCKSTSPFHLILIMISRESRLRARGGGIVCGWTCEVALPYQYPQNTHIRCYPGFSHVLHGTTNYNANHLFNFVHAFSFISV